MANYCRAGIKSLRGTTVLQTLVPVLVTTICLRLTSEPRRNYIRVRICKHSRSPGIDSKEVPPAYVAWRAGTIKMVVGPAARLHRLAESLLWNRFLGSLKVLKYRLWSNFATETLANTLVLSVRGVVGETKSAGFFLSFKNTI